MSKSDCMAVAFQMTPEEYLAARPSERILNHRNVENHLLLIHAYVLKENVFLGIHFRVWKEVYAWVNEWIDLDSYDTSEEQIYFYSDDADELCLALFIPVKERATVVRTIVDRGRVIFHAEY